MDWRPVSDMLLIKIQAGAVNTTDSSGGQENVLGVALDCFGVEGNGRESERYCRAFYRFAAAK